MLSVVVQGQVDLLVEARSRIVMGTPVKEAEPTPLQVLDAKLRHEEETSAQLKEELERMAKELYERARSEALQAKVCLHYQVFVGCVPENEKV